MGNRSATGAMEHKRRALQWVGAGCKPHHRRASFQPFHQMRLHFQFRHRLPHHRPVCTHLFVPSFFLGGCSIK
ncbi:unnamed protein product [Linum tenue]|uniref:Uncharacterized protein n=1 Tax=Linum tenue TaxID=586396 RepID=A0AAV0MKI3_9ROSI|nr:unnamed protein product [Linum tenue]